MEFYVDTFYERYGDDCSSIADELAMELIDYTMAYVHEFTFRKMIDQCLFIPFIHQIS